MTEPIAGGRRRVDRVLGEGFLDGLGALSLQELRERRHDAEQEDADLSYIRRLLQGRLDIIRAERERRAREAGDKVVDQLADVLSDNGPRSNHGSGRFLVVEPSRVAESRRLVEQIIADPHLSDVDTLTDSEIAQAFQEISAHEQAVSDLRRRVQQVMDTLTAEVALRYRDGRASVDELLKADGD